jgi:hypothetical protein
MAFRRPLVLGATLVAALACTSSAGAWVYWANDSGLLPTIGRANGDGSDVRLAFVKGAVQPCGVAVDSSHLYWADESTGAIGRANLDGSGADPSFITGADSPCGIAVDGAHVYWGNTALGNGSTIGRANLDGSGVNQRFITGARGPCGVAVDTAHIYWANKGALGATSGGTIGRANLDGSGVDQSFITGANDPCGVAVDASHIYWGNIGPKEQSTTIGRANLDGSGVDESFVTGASGPCGIAVDGGDSGPSSRFTLGKPVANPAAGTARLTVTLPGPGTLVVSGKGLRTVRSAAPHNGPVTVVVRPAKQLKRAGRLKVKANIAYTPTGGATAAAAATITFVRR